MKGTRTLIEDSFSTFEYTCIPDDISHAWGLADNVFYNACNEAGQTRSSLQCVLIYRLLGIAWSFFPCLVFLSARCGPRRKIDEGTHRLLKFHQLRNSCPFTCLLGVSLLRSLLCQYSEPPLARA